ncbi:protein-L-isoaspartate(D-aspartate) O-methyltransferase [Candidatus Latescibacterota bacterium]
MDYEVSRTRMLKEQIIKRGIKDERVLTAMGSVPRHLFVDQAFWPRAYGDYPLPIGNDQTISQPYIVALMSQELGLVEGSRVLEIGTGSGYQAAVLAVMGCTVFTIERHAELSLNAESIVKSLGISSVKFKVGDGTTGWPEESPYDGIIVTAGAPSVPEELIAQLNTGGRLVIPVGDRSSQRMQIIEKGENIIEKREITGCTFVPLIGKQGWENE